MYRLAVWLSAALDIGFLPSQNAKGVGTLCSLAYDFIIYLRFGSVLWLSLLNSAA